MLVKQQRVDKVMRKRMRERDEKRYKKERGGIRFLERKGTPINNVPEVLHEPYKCLRDLYKTRLCFPL